MSADSPQASRVNPASSGSAPNSPGIERVEVAFPPDEEGVSTLIGYCNKGELPVKFGRDVSLEKYNDWLRNSETGLRFSYDVEDRCVLLREGCYQSHGSTRAALIIALTAAFPAFEVGLGQIETARGVQNITPDVEAVGNMPGFPLLAEVGQSQDEDSLNARANLILSHVPGAECIILIKIFDTTTADNGRMMAWCASHNATGNLVTTGVVEFGRVGPGGAARNAWVAGTPPPVLAIPSTANIPATNLSLDGILTKLRRFNGRYWRHGNPP